MNKIIKHSFMRTVRNFTSENIFQYAEDKAVYIDSKIAIKLFDFGWNLFASINRQQKSIILE